MKLKKAGNDYCQHDITKAVHRVALIMPFEWGLLSIALIREPTDTNGQSKHYVHWKDEKSGHGHRRIFKDIDDAAHLFWQRQNIELDCRTASWAGIDHPWTFRKPILFCLGYQAGKIEKNIIRLSSYTKCRHDLLAVDGPILGKSIPHVSCHDIVDSVRTGYHHWIRSAFFLLVEKRLITFSPVNRPARRKRRPITIPPSSSVKELLNNAPVCGRIACWLGICGLRIGEALAVTYNDVSADWIGIRGHVIDSVTHEGLKRGVERRVWIPRGLFALLDKNKLGTSEPLICNQFIGACLATSYGTQGVLVRTLNDYGVKRSHHLRHFVVSRLADKDVDILKVSRPIGHSDIKTTMDVYGRPFGEVVETDLD